MIEIKYPRKLNHDELCDYFKNCLNLYNVRGCNDYKLEGSNITIHVNLPKFSDDKIFANVYGNNRIKLGELHVDNGVCGNGFYYPILVFYNQLNFLSSFCAYNEGSPNNIRIYPVGEELVINDSIILKAIRESFEYIKIFD